MKKILTLVVTILLFTSLALTGCSNSTYLKDNPPTNAIVIGNAGRVVQKGDYIYFINGFKSSNGLKAGQNDWGDHIHGAIYRTKVNADNTINYDEDGFVKKVEPVISKLVGYENGAFYIFGDYIYYSTPNNNKDRDGNSLTSLTDFFRININGDKETNTLLYTSKYDDITPNDWAIYDLNGTLHLVVKDGSTIISKKVNGKLGNTITLAKDVTSAVLYTRPEFYGAVASNEVINKVNNYVYYTRNFNKDDEISSTSGNVLARVKIGTNTEDKIYTNSNYTYQVIKHAGNNIYFTRTQATTPEGVTQIFRAQINEEEGPKLLTPVELLTTTSNDYFIVEYETMAVDNYVLVNTGSELQLFDSPNTYRVVATGESLTIVKYLSNGVIYKTSTEMYYLNNLTNPNSQPVEISLEDKNFNTNLSSLVDFDGRTIYIHAEYIGKENKQNYYLNRIDTHNINEDNTLTARFIGKFANSNHYPAKPDNEGKERTDEDWELWIK